MEFLYFIAIIFLSVVSLLFMNHRRKSLDKKLESAFAPSVDKEHSKVQVFKGLIWQQKFAFLLLFVSSGITFLLFLMIISTFVFLNLNMDTYEKAIATVTNLAFNYAFFKFYQSASDRLFYYVEKVIS